MSLAENGSMQRENFYEYITNIWLPFLKKLQVVFPVILYCDGHVSHISIPLVSFCRKNQIEIIILYPHATHITEPLDTSFFAPLKGEVWTIYVVEWTRKRGRRGLKKEDFAQVLELALDSWSNKKPSVISGFVRAGLYPLDKNKPEYGYLTSRKKKKPNAQNQNPSLIHSNSNSICNENPVQVIEAFIPPEILQKFKDCDLLSFKEHVDPEYIKLFEVWYKMKSGSIPSLHVGTYNLEKNR